MTVIYTCFPSPGRNGAEGDTTDPNGQTVLESSQPRFFFLFEQVEGYVHVVKTHTMHEHEKC